MRVDPSREVQVPVVTDADPGVGPWLWRFFSGSLNLIVSASSEEEALEKAGGWVREMVDELKLAFLISFQRLPPEERQLNLPPEDQGCVTLTSYFLAKYARFPVEDVARWEVGVWQNHGSHRSYQECLSKLLGLLEKKPRREA